MRARMIAGLLLTIGSLACNERPAPPFDPSCEKILSPAEIEAVCGVTLYGEPERRGPGTCSTEHREKTEMRAVAVSARVLWESFGTKESVSAGLGERRKQEKQVSGFADVPGVGDRAIRYVFSTGGTDITAVETVVDRWIIHVDSHGTAGKDDALCNSAELVDLAKIAAKNLRALP